ncbi:MAG: hypothetical protein IT446_08975 [Phycisphaerales bacterium]|nr:hypothetical protein [Phycisphaerales bacterium]
MSKNKVKETKKQVICGNKSLVTKNALKRIDETIAGLERQKFVAIHRLKNDKEFVKKLTEDIELKIQTLRKIARGDDIAGTLFE